MPACRLSNRWVASPPQQDPLALGLIGLGGLALAVLAVYEWHTLQALLKADDARVAMSEVGYASRTIDLARDLARAQAPSMAAESDACAKLGLR
jgi:predicted short-subunit dehydrogenase-like oxidoreductase (DUF2520 family)